MTNCKKQHFTVLWLELKRGEKVEKIIFMYFAGWSFQFIIWLYNMW